MIISENNDFLSLGQRMYTSVVFRQWRQSQGECMSSFWSVCVLRNIVEKRRDHEAYFSWFSKYMSCSFERSFGGCKRKDAHRRPAALQKVTFPGEFTSKFTFKTRFWNFRHQPGWFYIIFSAAHHRFAQYNKIKKRCYVGNLLIAVFIVFFTNCDPSHFYLNCRIT